MTQMQTHSLRLERTYNAPLAKVRNALTDPKALAKWFAPGPMAAAVHRLEARAGGRYEIAMTGPGEDGKVATHTCTGTFRKLTDTHVSMTFNWTEGDLPDTVLSFDLEAVKGGTRLVLTHTGFPTKDAAAMHTQGWEGCLEKLPQSL